MVKKENCKDCYEATCRRHATEEPQTVLDGISPRKFYDLLRISALDRNPRKEWRDIIDQLQPTLKNLPESTLADFGIYNDHTGCTKCGYYGHQKENCTCDCEHAPKKEELRCGVDNLVINGYSVHYGGIPFCFLHDPMRHGKLQPLNLFREGHLHVMTGADPVCIRCKKSEQELGRDWPIEEPKVDLSKLFPVGWYSVHTKGKLIPFAPKESDPELALSVSQMKELKDNLVYAGFTNKEAVFITGMVARK